MTSENSNLPATDQTQTTSSKSSANVDPSPTTKSLASDAHPLEPPQKSQVGYSNIATKRVPVAKSPRAQTPTLYKEVIVSTKDENLLNQFNWKIDNQGYVGAYTNNTRVYLHRLIANAEVGFPVDHINGNKQDNRRSNLRVLTPTGNQLNRVSSGVSYDPSGANCTKPWVARYSKLRLGRFSTREEAASFAFNYKQEKLEKEIVRYVE